TAKRMDCNCTVVAGEFFKYTPTYDLTYIATIIKARHIYGAPRIWGLHDYEDLINYHKKHQNPGVRGFLDATNTIRLSHPHIWLSELGVELQDNKDWTPLVCNRGWQEEAAEDLLSIGPSHSRIEREYDYLYYGPTNAAIEKAPHKHTFDSALFPGAGLIEEDKCKTENPRPAYCVLAYVHHRCPPIVNTLPPITSATDQKQSVVGLTVNPENSPTHYFVEYGETTSYGHSTSPVALPNDKHEQSASVKLTELSACTTYHYQAEAHNEANEGVYSLGGNQSFSTACEETHNGIASWGDNKDAELGRPTSASAPCDSLCGIIPRKIAGVTGVKEVAAGGGQALALLEDGVVLAWGSNLLESYELPSFVVGEATAVAAGENFGLALLASGKVMSWGFGGQGQLGNGAFESSILPVEVSGISNATSIAAGADFALARLSDGSVVAWGSNSIGQLGNGSIEGPALCGFDSCSTVPISTDIEGARMVSAGGDDGFALMEDGTVDSWGSGAEGELGNGTHPEYADTPVKVSGLENAISIAADNANGFALTSDGSVRSWGHNYYGQLGVGGTSPNECGSFEVLDCSTTPVTVDDLSEVVAIAAGGAHAMALLSDGKVKTWGEDGSGQLGTGDLPAALCGEGSAFCSTSPMEAQDLGGVQGIAAGRGFDLAWGGELLDDK
ncbi:MAG TPA: hypothetical protein VFR48_08670, partial [Solirubrobacteraceae bacterium]|nr:hypothetical protein [Solirubrobacteraceae bacterium]